MADSSDELIEELVFACLEAEDPKAAVEKVCADHPELAARIRRVLARLDSADFLASATVTASPTVPRSEMELPDEIGGFRLLSRLGAGGMGVVYLAEETQLGRQVAVKLVRPEQLYFAGARVRFQREIEAIARLHHPGIVTIHSVGEENGVPFFSMDYVRGIALSRLIARLRDTGKPARVRTKDVEAQFDTQTGSDSGSAVPDVTWTAMVTRIVRDVARALAHAHEQGVLHRDVKPSNILLDDHLQPRLLDFGLARTEDAQQITRTTSQLGSLPYMPPEQFGGGTLRQEPTLDVYALGVTMYELLTFRSPFLAETADETRANILAAAPTRPRALNNAIDLDLETVCLTAMDPNPARRYLSMNVFAADLDNLLEHRPIVARPAGRVLRTWRWVQRHPTVSVAVTMASVLFALTVWFAWDQLQRQRETEQRNYVLGVANANASLDAYRAREAKASLLQCPEHLRRFEWHHLALRSQGDIRVFRGHDGRVRSLVVHPAGKQFVSTGEDGSIRSWDLATGAELTKVCLPDRRPGQPHIANDCLFTAAGVLYLACDDGKLRYSQPGREEFGVAHESKTRGVPQRIVLHPDQTQLVCGFTDGRLVRLDLATGAVQPISLLPVQRHSRFESGAIQALSFVPDGGRLLVARLRELDVVDVKTWKHVDTIRHSQFVMTARGLEGDNRILTSGTFGRTRWWGPGAESVASDPAVTMGVNVALVDAPRERVVVAGSYGAIRILGLKRLDSRFTLQGHEGNVTDMEFLADGRHLLSSSYDGTIRLWDTAAPPATARLGDESTRTVNFSADGRKVVTGGRTGLVAWDLENGDRKVWVAAKPRTAGIRDVDRTAAGEKFVMAMGEVAVFDAATGATQTVAGLRSITRVAWLADDRRFVAARNDGTVFVADSHTGEVLSEGRPHEGANRFSVSALAVCRWSDRIVLGTEFGEIVLRDPETLGVDVVRKLFRVRVYSLAPDPRSQSLLVADRYGNVRFVGSVRGDPVRPGTAWPDAVISSFAFDPAGTRMITATRGREVRIWEWPQMRRLMQMSTLAPINEARFTPDGTRIVAATETGIRVWNSVRR